MRGVSTLASSVPLIGGFVGGVLNSLQDLSDGINNTARRLSQYNPLLAVQQVSIDLRNTFRDIERSFRLGPDLIQAVEARQELNERIQELIDKYAPTIIRLLTSIMEFIGNAVEGTEQAVHFIQDVGTRISYGFNQQAASDVITRRDNERQLAQIIRNTSREAVAIALFDSIFSQIDITQTPFTQRPGFNPNAANPIGVP